MQVTVEKITPFKIGGAGNGNTYHYQVSYCGMTVLASCERDVASDFKMAGLPVPEEFQGPYDCYGRKIDAQ
jgi:hypothetical protein